jgi:hypothetical protein
VGDATKFAIAIAIIFAAMVCFFFAFHPGGVQGVSDPQSMLEWLSSEFQQTGSTGTGGNAPLDAIGQELSQAQQQGTPPQATRNAGGPAFGQGSG